MHKKNSCEDQLGNAYLWQVGAETEIFYQYTPEDPTDDGTASGDPYTQVVPGPEWVVLQGSARQHQAVPQEGEKVWARFGAVNYYEARITVMHRDGTISVQFIDGACHTTCKYAIAPARKMWMQMSDVMRCHVNM